MRIITTQLTYCALYGAMSLAGVNSGLATATIAVAITIARHMCLHVEKEYAHRGALKSLTDELFIHALMWGFMSAGLFMFEQSQILGLILMLSSLAVPFVDLLVSRSRPGKRSKPN